MEIVEKIRRVSESLDADIYMVSGGIVPPADETLIRCVKEHISRANVLLVLSTFGGSADVAYRMARCLQRNYKGKFLVLVCSHCKSAGTVLTLGASELVISDTGQLGPLDVQLARPDELADVISGLTPVQALAFLEQRSFSLFEYCFLELVNRSNFRITTKTAAEIATRIATGLFEPVYAQLDPIRLGEYRRDMQVAYEYGERLAHTRGSAGGNLKEGTLEHLTHHYPSHGFVIDRDEAKELFTAVREPTAPEQELIDDLAMIIQEDLRKPVASVIYLPSTLDDRDAGDGKERSDGNTEGSSCADEPSEGNAEAGAVESHEGSQETTGEMPSATG